MQSKSVLVHVGVTRALQAELESGSKTVNSLAKRLNLKHVRDDRLAAFGVLTAEADEAAIEKIREEPGIEFVEKDSQKHAI